MPQLLSLTQLLGSLATADSISAECQKLLVALKSNCPGVLSPDPLPAGELGPEILLLPGEAEQLYRLVARRVTGLPDPPNDPASPPVPGIVVWTRGGDELAVVIDKISLRPANGVVAVDIPVRCDEVGDATVRVRFAVGSKDRPAGMLAATDERPFGPPLVIDVWGEALMAFAWQTLVRAMTRLADATGRDVDGAGLLPVALAATPDSLALRTMARHTFDRRATP